MRQSVTGFIFRNIKSRNSVKAVMLAMLFMMICISDFTIVYGQSIPSAEIFVDQSDKNYPLRLTIATNENKEIASMRITASDPTQIVAFSTDTKQYNVYPIGENGMGIRAIVDTNFLPTGSNITVARFMTDSVQRQQSYKVEFLNRNGGIIYETDVPVDIPPIVRLAPPCTRQTIDLTTGVNTAGVNITPGSTDMNWVMASGDVIGLPPPTTLPVYVLPPLWGSTPGAINPQSPWLNYSTNQNGGNSPGNYSFWRKFCVQEEADVNIFIRMTADFSCKAYFVNSDGTETFLGATAYQGFTGEFVFSTTVSASSGACYIRILAYDDGCPCGFRLNTTSNVSTNSGALGFSGNRCCDPTSLLEGYKYWDKNCNGMVDKDDIGLPGWTITATPTAGGTPIVATTGPGGLYSMSLSPATYTLTETIQSGWTSSTSSGPYTVNILPIPQSHRFDFLNCKKPTCEELFTNKDSESGCCQGGFNISNANGVTVTQLSFSVTGGVLTGVNASCLPATSPDFTGGLTNGTITFNPACANMGIDFSAKSTTASGKVCVVWTAEFQQGTETFKCSKEICLNCIRMPKDCGDALQVTPYIFGDLNTDWRTFQLSNVKLPLSEISYVDANFVIEPGLHHNGGGLYVNSGGPIQPRSWTLPNSGGVADPYTKIRMDCQGSTGAPQGLAAINWLRFNLGVDKTLNYNGTVHIKIGYCDGDTCEFDYAWVPPVNISNNGSLDSAIRIRNPRLIRLTLAPPEKTWNIGIRLGNAKVRILAVTPPCASLDNDCDETSSQFSVVAKENTALLSRSCPWCCYECPPDSKYILTIAYTGTEDSEEKLPVKVSYYDKSGAEIGQAEREFSTTISSVIPGINTPNNDAGAVINSIIPNPSSNEVFIKYTLQETEVVKVELVNSLGQIVRVLADGLQQSGIREIKYNVESISAGTYYLRLSTKDGSVAKVMKVIH